MACAGPAGNAIASTCLPSAPWDSGCGAWAACQQLKSATVRISGGGWLRSWRTGRAGLYRVGGLTKAKATVCSGLGRIQEIPRVPRGQVGALTKVCLFPYLLVFSPTVASPPLATLAALPPAAHCPQPWPGSPGFPENHHATAMLWSQST